MTAHHALRQTGGARCEGNNGYVVRSHAHVRRDSAEAAVKLIELGGFVGHLHRQLQPAKPSRVSKQASRSGARV
jgi:hypothetical protein